MVAVKNILLFIHLAAAASIQKRVQFAQLILDSVTIDQNIKTLTDATLDQSIKTATSNAQQYPVMSSDEAANMGALVENYIIPDTSTLLIAMEAKKQDFVDVGVLPTVQNLINSLRTDQAAYSSALLNITPPTATDLQRGQSDAATIDGFFAAAAAYFSR